jgi:DNA-directed RNA polymerase subunit RPC12/RpoP
MTPDDPREGLTPTVCPYCGYKLDAAKSPDHPSARPRAGDVSVCMRCGGTLEYTSATGTVKTITLEELPAEIRPEIKRIQQAIRLMRRGN